MGWPFSSTLDEYPSPLKNFHFSSQIKRWNVSHCSQTNKKKKISYLWYTFISCKIKLNYFSFQNLMSETEVSGPKLIKVLETVFLIVERRKEDETGVTTTCIIGTLSPSQIWIPGVYLKTLTGLWDFITCTSSLLGVQIPQNFVKFCKIL